MKKYKVIIDRKKCFACGTCQAISPQHFKINHEDGLVEVIGFEEKNGQIIVEIDESQLIDFESAAKACPENIIKIQK